MNEFKPVEKRLVLDKLAAPPAPTFTKEMLLSTRITKASKVPPIQPVVWIGDSIFAIRGDISFIAGPPKAGKTSVCTFIEGTAFLKDVPPTMDTLAIRTAYHAGRPIVHIDTEQPQAHTKTFQEKMQLTMGLDSLPEDLFWQFNWRHQSWEENRAALEAIFEHIKKPHLVVIDGISDLIRSVNDEEGANEIIRYLMAKAGELDTAIILLIHENPNGGKLRGHLGSEAERKCGGSITIRKDKAKGLHWIEPRMIRGSKDFDNIYFRYNPNTGLMEQFDQTTQAILRDQTDPEVSKLENLHRVARQATMDAKETPDKRVFIDRICLYDNPSKPISAKTAERRFKDMLEKGLITLDAEGHIIYLPPTDNKE